MLRSFILAGIAWTIAFLLAIPTFFAMLFVSLFYGKEVIEKYLLGVAIGLDQFGASLLGWNQDTTISGNIGYRLQHGKATFPERWLCAVLRMLDVQHCMKSIELDEVYE